MSLNNNQQLKNELLKIGYDFAKKYNQLNIIAQAQPTTQAMPYQIALELLEPLRNDISNKDSNISVDAEPKPITTNDLSSLPQLLEYIKSNKIKYMGEEIVPQAVKTERGTDTAKLTVSSVEGLQSYVEKLRTDAVSSGNDIFMLMIGKIIKDVNAQYKTNIKEIQSVVEEKASLSQSKEKAQEKSQDLITSFPPSTIIDHLPSAINIFRKDYVTFQSKSPQGELTLQDLENPNTAFGFLDSRDLDIYTSDSTYAKPNPDSKSYLKDVKAFAEFLKERLDRFSRMNLGDSFFGNLKKSNPNLVKEYQKLVDKLLGQTSSIPGAAGTKPGEQKSQTSTSPISEITETIKKSIEETLTTLTGFSNDPSNINLKLIYDFSKWLKDASQYFSTYQQYNISSLINKIQELIPDIQKQTSSYIFPVSPRQFVALLESNHAKVAITQEIRDTLLAFKGICNVLILDPQLAAFKRFFEEYIRKLETVIPSISHIAQSFESLDRRRK